MLTVRSLVGVAVAATFVLALGPAGLARPSTVNAATAIPSRVFAPYFQMWTGQSIKTTAEKSGARYFTLAFLESLNPTSCTLAWNGDSGKTVASGAFLSDINGLRAMGGNVIPSLGGFSAGEDGTDIADSCTNVNTIANAYKSLITTYDVSRLDMDVEGGALENSGGIDRRNKAIKIVQDWAVANGRPLKISYTLPTSRTGLDSDALAVLQNAVTNGVRLDIVQPMVFDYYDGAGTDMGDSAISALKGLYNQLKTLMPSKTKAQIWAMEGAIIMNGRSDYPGPSETTSIADAKQLLKFAKSKNMAVLAMWAIQRDNGSCPGVSGAGNCSGISQAKWAFTKVLKAFKP